MNRNLRFAALLVVLLLNGLACSATASAQEQVARDYYGGNVDQALRNMNRYHYEPALKALQLRKYRSAQGELEFMLRYIPNHPQALAKMGEVSIATQRPDLAERHFQTAIARYPQHAETHVIYGTFLHKLGRIDAAIAEYRRALEMDPDSAYAHYNLGLAYVDRKDYSQANVHAQKAYELRVTFPGLRKKLEDAGAWRPVERASSTPADAASSGKQQDKRKAD